MKTKLPYFIGWSGDIPSQYLSLLRKFTVGLFVVSLAFIIIFTLSQKGFIPRVAEYGKLSTHEGVLITEPHPMLVQTSEEGMTEVVMLVGFGKFSARPALEKWEELNNEDLEGKNVHLEGTLLQSQGIRFLELTRHEQSVLSVAKAGFQIDIPDIAETAEEITITGEILDAKCYWGAMSPAEGKIHRSCAIRCLSGGIPAGFRTAGGSHVILKANGQNQMASFFGVVGQTIELKGRIESFGNTDFFYLSPDQVKFQSYFEPLDRNLTLCNITTY
jgi:hypothetical protein